MDGSSRKTETKRLNEAEDGLTVSRDCLPDFEGNGRACLLKQFALFYRKHSTRLASKSFLGFLKSECYLATAVLYSSRNFQFFFHKGLPGKRKSPHPVILAYLNASRGGWAIHPSFQRLIFRREDVPFVRLRYSIDSSESDHARTSLLGNPSLVLECR